MNKYFVQFAENYSLQTKGETVYGNYRGYTVSTAAPTYGQQQMGMTVYVSCYTMGKKQEIADFLAAEKKNLKLIKSEVFDDGVYIAHMPMTNKQIIPRTEAILNAVTDKLAALEVPGSDSCPYCGETMEEKATVTSGNCVFSAHRDCAEKYVESIKQGEAVLDSLPGNYGKGFLGAVLGALCGCVVWAVFYFIGYIAGIIAVLVGFLSSLLYDKFGGKNDKKKIVIIAAVSLLSIIITMFAVYIIMIAIELNNEGIAGSAFAWFFELLRSSADYRNAIISDTIFSLVFACIGVVYSIVTLRRSQVKSSKTITIE